MIRRNGLAACLISAGLLLAGAVGVRALDASAVREALKPWGRHGHELSGRVAAASLPEAMPAFFRAAAPQLEYLNVEPDRWRERSATAMDEAWKYDHYVDFEVIPPAALDAPDRFTYLQELEQRTDLERPARDAGLLPYRIHEMYQRLVREMRLWRAEEDSARRAWIAERIINDAGILGHYVADGSNPQHTSVHHNGWNEDFPNPNNYTTERNFHSRFESRFVEAHLSAEDLLPRMARAPRRLSADVRADVMAYLRASNAQLDRLYQLEQQERFGPETTSSAHHEFAIQRLVAGAEMLRALWWTAWLESGEPVEES